MYTSECGYSIVQAPEALHEVTVIPTALPKMPPLTEANKGIQCGNWFVQWCKCYINVSCDACAHAQVCNTCACMCV